MTPLARIDVAHLTLNFIFCIRLMNIECFFSALNIRMNTNIYNLHAIFIFVQDNSVYLQL